MLSAGVCVPLPFARPSARAGIPADRRVRVGRAGVEPLRQAELRADLEHRGEQRARAVEPAAGPAADLLDLDDERRLDAGREPGRKRSSGCSSSARISTSRCGGSAIELTERPPERTPMFTGASGGASASRRPGELEERVHRTRSAAVDPRVAARAEDGDPRPDGADGVDEDAVEAVTLERDHVLRAKPLARCGRAAEVAHPLLGHGERDGAGGQLGAAVKLLQDRDRKRDRGRVVADPGPRSRPSTRLTSRGVPPGRRCRRAPSAAAAAALPPRSRAGSPPRRASACPARLRARRSIQSSRSASPNVGAGIRARATASSMRRESGTSCVRSQGRKTFLRRESRPTVKPCQASATGVLTASAQPVSVRKSFF